MPQDAYDFLQPRAVIVGNSPAAMALAKRIYREFGIKATILTDGFLSLPRTLSARYRRLPSLSHTGILRQELDRLTGEETDTQLLLFLGRDDCRAPLLAALRGAEERYLCLFGRQKKSGALPPDCRRHRLCGFGDGKRVWIFGSEDDGESRAADALRECVGYFALTFGGGKPAVFSSVIPAELCLRRDLPVLELPLRHLVLCENEDPAPESPV